VYEIATPTALPGGLFVSITAIGCILLPLGLWYWRCPAQLLMLVLIYSVFSASAIIIVGGLGITSALMPTSMFIVLFAVNAFNSTKYPAERQALMLLFPFILVVCGALLSSFVMPRLFEGDVLVWPQKVVAFFVRSPLAPNAGNVTQDMYLAINALLLVTAALYLTKLGAPLGRLIDCYFFCGILVAFIGIWQFAGSMLPIPFPTQFFLSNPGWALLSDQTMGSLTRLNGTFSEPAALSAYACATVSTSAWVILNGDRRHLPRVALCASLLILLLTTASTGYITLLAMSALLVLRGLFSKNAVLRRRTLAALGLVVVLAGVVTILMSIATPKIVSTVQTVFDATTNKTQSASYRARSTADWDSLQELYATYGLGVGWGSNRSSSLLPGLFAAIGLWGVGALIWFGLALAWQARRAVQLTDNSMLHYAIRGSSASLISSLISAMLSGPTISSPDFYLMLAILVAATARSLHENVVSRRIIPTQHPVRMVQVYRIDA
jgi:hypothetical protein